MISKHFHQIWLCRGKEFGVMERASVISRMRLYGNEFKYTLWTDDTNFNPNIEGLEVQYLHQVVPKITRDNSQWDNWIGNKGVAFEADYYRQHLLYEIGGIYCDTDFIAVRRLPEDWFNEDYVSCIEYEPSSNRPAGLMIGYFMTAPKHEYLRRFIDKRNQISVKLINNMQFGLTQLYSPLSMKIVDTHYLLPVGWIEEELREFLDGDKTFSDYDCYEFHCYGGALGMFNLEDKMTKKITKYMNL